MGGYPKWLTFLQGAVIAFAIITSPILGLECHPQGPIFPRPRNLTNSAMFESATRDMASLLDSAVTNKIRAGWDTRNVSISIGLVSLDQVSPSTPAWEYHHLAAGTVDGTKSLDKNSLYMIGSVSKVITDAIFIKSGVNPDDVVTKYLPELGGDESKINWREITLGMLAGQLSGIPPNYGFSEYYYLHQYFEYLGFPELNESEYPPCGITGLNEGCTREQFLKGLLTLHPVSSPNNRPVYSNIAYTLLAYAIQSFLLIPSNSTNSTITPYAHLLNTLITKPLNMPHTFPSGSSPPSPPLSPTANLTSQAVIPPVPNNFNASYGDDTPGGGLISSLSDLSSLLHSILSRTTFDNASSSPLTQARVREWLQPRSFLGSEHTFLGMPWEIYRPPKGLFFGNGDGDGNVGYTVTIVAKDGTAYGYRARIAVVDELGVGVVVLVAGDTTSSALEVVYGAVMKKLVPAVSEVAREEVEGEGGYAGGFVGGGGGKDRNKSESGSGSIKVEAKMEVMGDGSSLRLSELKRNGTDMLKGLEDIWAVSIGALLPRLRNNGTWRLYPAEVVRAGEETVRGRQVGVVREDWRLWWDVEVVVETDLPGQDLIANDCSSWSVTDWLYYGGEPVDRVVFVKDKETGEVLGVDVPFLRTGVMTKTHI